MFSMKTHFAWRSPTSTASWSRKIDQATAARTAHSASSGPSPSTLLSPRAPPNATNARLSTTDVAITAAYDSRINRRVPVPARGRNRFSPAPSPSWAMPEMSSNVEMTAELAPYVEAEYSRAASTQYSIPSPAENTWLATSAYALAYSGVRAMRTRESKRSVTDGSPARPRRAVARHGYLGHASSPPRVA